jgi:hypothetical protein
MNQRGGDMETDFGKAQGHGVPVRIGQSVYVDDRHKMLTSASMLLDPEQL